MKPYCASLRSSRHSYLFSGEVQMLRLGLGEVCAQARVFLLGLERLHLRLAVFGLVAREARDRRLCLAADRGQQLILENLRARSERLVFGADRLVHRHELAALVLGL